MCRHASADVKAMAESVHTEKEGRLTMKQSLLSVVTAIGLLNASSTWAQTSFGSRLDFVLPTADQSREVAGGDLTGDGLSDLVVAGLFGGIVVYPSTGAGSFGTPQVVSVPATGFITGIVLADLDGDGDLDAAMTSKEDVFVLENQAGLLAYTQSIQASPNPTLHSISSADLDGDGDLDLITTLEGPTISGDELILLENDGAGSFSLGQSLVFPPPPNTSMLDAAPADVDADGDVDLIFSLAPNLAVSLNDGTGNFGSVLSFPVASDIQQMVVKDFDGNGYPDVAMVAGAPGTSRVVLNLGVSGGGWLGFGATSDLVLGGSGLGLAALDVDADGDIDLVGAVHDTAELAVFLNDGSGVFTIDVRIATPTCPWHLSVADIDGDGFDDVLGARHDTPNPGVDRWQPTYSRPNLR